VTDTKELAKSIEAQTAELAKFEARVKELNALFDAAVDKRDREGAKQATSELMRAESDVSKCATTIKRMRDALNDAEFETKRDSIGPLRDALITGVKLIVSGNAKGLQEFAASVAGFGDLVKASDGLDGVAINVATRENGALLSTGPNVGVQPRGAWYKSRTRSGNGGARTAGSHYTYEHDGRTYSEAELVATFANKVWDGDKLQRVLDNAKGENRIRNSLRVAKELGITPMPIA